MTKSRKPRRRKKQTTVYLAGEQIDKLELVSERTKIPVAVLVREGLDMVLANHKEKLHVEVQGRGRDQASEEDDGA